MQQLQTILTKIAEFPRAHLIAISVICAALAIFSITTTPSAEPAFQESVEIAIPFSTLDNSDTLSNTQISNQTAIAIADQSPDTTPLAEAHFTQNLVIDTVRSGDSLAKIFKRQKLAPQTLHKIMTSSEEAQILKKIHPGQELAFAMHEGELVKLFYYINKLETLEVEKSDDTFITKVVRKELETKAKYSRGVINNALFLSAKEAGLTDNMTMQLANIFGWDIDFVLDIRQGDSFELIYEEKFVEGEKYQDGDILIATFTNQGKEYTAIRYEDPDGRVDYYSPEGKSVRKAFLRTPVDFKRISSKFNLKRKHPIFKTTRPHKGVDSAAPTGTPIKAAGDGKIVVARNKGGYGKAVVIQHGQKYSTLYGHLSKWGRGIKEGRRVKQGQIIGYVGSTGWATGPHLHYEFRVNGVHRNPLTVKLPAGQPIAKKFKDQFLAHAAGMRGQLAMNSDYHSTLAQNEYE